MFKPANKALVGGSVFLLAMLLNNMAQAHPRLLIPSHFALSNSDGQWVSFDVTGSHSVFQVDKPGSAQSAKILRPDGQIDRPTHVVRAKRRSTFDAFFAQPGTHKVSVVDGPKYGTRYKDTSGERHKLAADKLARANLMPDGAKQVSTSFSVTRSESYITLGAPSEEALAIEGKYLEVLPVTHPADLIAGQSAEFQLFIEGKPLTDVTVELIAEGSQYRDALNPLKATTDEQGKV